MMKACKNPQLKVIRDLQFKKAALEKKILKASKTQLSYAVNSMSHSELRRFSRKHNVEFITITHVFQLRQTISNDRTNY